MKIIEAIQAVDTLKPNTYSELEKIQWLSKLDSTIKINGGRKTPTREKLWKNIKL